MTSYAVIWSYRGECHARAGRLELRCNGIALHGGAGEHEVREQLELREIAHVRRLPHAERLAHLPSLQIERRIGPTLLIAATAGVGAFSEILDKLSSAIAG